MDMYFQYLKNVYFFQSLADADIARIQEVCREETVESDRIVVSENTSGDNCYIILEGSVEIWKDFGKPESDRIAVIGPGEVFGELALIDDLPRSATVITKEDSRFLLVSRNDFTRIIQESNPISLSIMKTVSTKIRMSNERFIDDLRSRNQMLEKTCNRLETEIQERKKAEEALRKSRDSLETEVANRTKDLVDANAKLRKEIEERIQAEESLKVMNFAIESSNDAIFFADIGGNLTYANPAFLKLWGYSDAAQVLGKPSIRFIADKEKAHEVMDRVAETGSWQGEFVTRTKDGLRLNLYVTFHRVVDNTGNLICLKASCNDITEQKRLQDQLIRSERLAASGQLSASIAHEINSPLQAITIMLGMIGKKHQDDDDLKENIALLENAFASIRDTVKNLLDLNRPGTENKQWTNINDIIEKTVNLMRSHLKRSKISVNLDLSSRIPEFQASPQQLSQVFLNLINNSIESMADRANSKPNNQSNNRNNGQKEITIKTNHRKGRIVIRLADNGPGIQKDEMQRIFDPFYTRKKTMGMGVGLSVCHGIIEEHNGTISVRNSAKDGAVFIITLPVL